MLGEQLIRWTVWVSLAAYVGRWVLEWSSVPRTSAAAARLETARRRVWSIGCVFLWLHVACAFQFTHGWSHSAAVQATARETAAVTGWDWGGGVWFNYLLLALWSADCLWWRLSPATFRFRGRLVEAAWQGYFGMIVFSATVLFEEGAVRWLGVAVSCALITLLAGRRARRAIVLAVVLWCGWQAFPVAASDSPAEVKVGLVAFEDFRAEYDRSRRLLADLARQSDVPLRFRVAVGTYGDVAHWLRAGLIDVAVVTPGLLAEFLAEGPPDERRSLPVEYLASAGKPAAVSPCASAARRRPGYHDCYSAVCLVAADSPWRTIAEVEQALRSGRAKLVCVHPASVSSRIAPAFALRQDGVPLDTVAVEYTHSHTASVRRAADSQGDGAAPVAFVWDDALRGAPELASRVRAIPFPGLESLAIPTDAVLVRTGFPLADLLRRLLLAHADDGGRQDFVRLDDWRERYGEIRRWEAAISADSADPQRIALEEIGRLLVHHARSQPAPPRLALVLSGGGAKCSYQVGAVAAVEEMLAELRQEDSTTALDINLVVGTSGGAINAFPIALGVTRTPAGRADFLDVWSRLDQRKIVRPARIVRGNIGLWFALAQTAVTLWFIRRFVADHVRRAWVFGGVFAGLASVEIFVRYLDLSPWSWLGHNHWLHHAWLWMSFGIGASAWCVLAIGLVVLWLQWRRVRSGSYLGISTRAASRLLAAGLLGLPFIQVVTVLFFQTTLSGGEGIERSLAEHFPGLINAQLARDALKPVEPGAGKTPAQQLKAVSREVIERRLLARDLVLTGSCLEQSSATLPSDLYFHATGRGSGNPPPFGPRGVSLEQQSGLLLDVVMGSGSIFPVFPSRKLEDFPQPGEYVELVDGGFAHNSPIEAAVLWGATHVILIEASPRERAGRDNFLQNAAASFDHLYEQSQLLDTRSRGKVAVFTLAPDPPHLCVLDFADNLIRASAARGHSDASGRTEDGQSVGPPRFRKELGEPIFAVVEPE